MLQHDKMQLFNNHVSIKFAEPICSDDSYKFYSFVTSRWRLRGMILMNITTNYSYISYSIVAIKCKTRHACDGLSFYYYDV